MNKLNSCDILIDLGQPAPIKINIHRDNAKELETLIASIAGDLEDLADMEFKFNCANAF